MNRPIPASGIARHIDELGRLVIPKEMRRRMGWHEGSLINIAVEGDTIRCTKVNTEREIDDTFRHLVELIEDTNPTPRKLQTIRELKALQEAYEDAYGPEAPAEPEQ